MQSIDTTLSRMRRPHIFSWVRARSVVLAMWPAVPALALQELLGEVLISRNLVASLLSPGAQTPWFAAIASLLFVTLRLFVVCGLPIWISFRVFRAVLLPTSQADSSRSSAPVA
jgi:hypothetical protein